MKLTLYNLSGDNAARARQADNVGSAGTWVQFGKEVVLLEEDTAPSDTARAHLASSRTLAEEISREQLYLVVQKGRVFQQEHPEASIVVDKGRYLIVQLPSEVSAQITTPERPCFTITPLPENAVIFEAPDRALARAAPIPWIQALVDALSLSTYEADLTHLVDFRTRFSTSDGFAEAADWAAQQLEAAGYTVRRETVSLGGQRRTQNIIADRIGNSPEPRSLVLVTAHLDSINQPGGPNADAPGADDNASGSAGILAMARVFGTHSALHDIRFILFGGEEQGLFGSTAHVASLSATERGRIHSVINMDMIAAQNTPTPTVLLEGHPISQFILDGLVESANTYTPLEVQTSLTPHDSDHVPFIENGIPAVLTIEGADSANDHIHTGNDKIEFLQITIALEILRMNTAFVASVLGNSQL